MALCITASSLLPVPTPPQTPPDTAKTSLPHLKSGAADCGTRHEWRRGVEQAPGTYYGRWHDTAHRTTQQAKRAHGATAALPGVVLRDEFGAGVCVCIAAGAVWEGQHAVWEKEKVDGRRGHGVSIIWEGRAKERRVKDGRGRAREPVLPTTLSASSSSHPWVFAAAWSCTLLTLVATFWEREQSSLALVLKAADAKVVRHLRGAVFLSGLHGLGSGYTHTKYSHLRSGYSHAAHGQEYAEQYGRGYEVDECTAGIALGWWSMRLYHNMPTLLVVFIVALGLVYSCVHPPGPTGRNYVLYAGARLQ
ncbi:hypothetical protein B0H11DRAFT_1923374 [Mycena galericulata]|nr:hypothetical protein B0H11DRAFT_1923374 [Mycena galericulata]